MFPTRFFDLRFWAGRYWPKIGATSTTAPRQIFVVASRATAISAMALRSTAPSVSGSTSTAWTVLGFNAAHLGVSASRGTSIAAGGSEV